MTREMKELGLSVSPGSETDSTRDVVEFELSSGEKVAISNDLEHIPNGLQVASTCLGIKKSGKLDFTVVKLPKPGAIAGVLTKSRSASPTIARNRSVLSSKVAQAIVVNSGNANVFTPSAEQDLEEVSALVEKELGVLASHQIISSTGVIGVKLPMECFRKGIPKLGSKLSAGDLVSASQAIMTTDIGPKVASVKIGDVLLAGIAKGAGMIEPKMATMLVYFFTNADLSSGELQEMLNEANRVSFNSISVDADTSTSDSVFICSTGEIQVSDSDRADLSSALSAMCVKLSRDIVSQGEGVSKLIEARVATGISYEYSHRLAKKVINSPLVKTAVHGADPNWGRVVMAIGKPEVGFDDDPFLDPKSIVIKVQDVVVYDCMKECSVDWLSLSNSMKAAKDILIDVEIGDAKYVARTWGGDLTNDYIRINAEYTT